MTMTVEGLADAPIETPRSTIAQQVFDHLLTRIITVDLAPGARLSEAEVAKALGVSRQPVREAFFRLSQAGLLVIRPQRATMIAPISERDVFQAQFVRLALETATIRRACRVLGEADFAAIEALIVEQRAAVDADDRLRFHGLDDEMHRQIGERSGAGFAWGLIREHKIQMDRVRYLSLAFGSEVAWREHVGLLERLRARDVDGAVAALTDHLSKIDVILRRIRAEHEGYFTPERGELLRAG